MEIELQEIRDFIARAAPFDVLPVELLNLIPEKTTIRYLRRGSSFPPPDVAVSSIVMLRSGAIELRDEEGNLLEKLGEGDVFGDVCQAADTSVPGGITTEDSLIYLIPCQLIETLCERSEIFRQHFADSLEERIKSAIAYRKSRMPAYDAMHLEVGPLIYRTPVTVDIETSIQQAAQVMARENISSLLIMEGERLAGMLTDRDLRNRCLAKEISRSEPVREIMSNKLVTITHRTLLSDALLVMTRNQIHHLPVLDGDRPVGNLTVSDIIRHLSTNPAFIASDIQQARSVKELSVISQRLPELQLQLARANSTARQIGEVISSITDALTCRLLQLGEEQFGSPPVPYTWVAGGSQARNEQTSHSDQDNALILHDSFTDVHAPYFEKLAGFVCDGLDACGFEYCPGNAMASNPSWRQPVRVWLSYFDNWIDKPDPKALMLSCIFFDLRAIYGEFQLYEKLQQQVLSRTSKNGIFIAYMVANALSHRPPLGFFRNFVLVHDGEHNNTLDIKHRGVIPIVDIARVFALAEGLPQTNSTERLLAAHKSGALSKEMSENLTDALELIAGLRIRHQARQIREGQPADNFLPPDSLSGLERAHLKDAFSIIKTMQEVLENRHQADRLT